MKRLLFAIGASLFLLSDQAPGNEVKVFEPTGTIPYLSVEESLKTFQLPEGYHLEPVLTEPAISEPVAIAFDGNGRMYVVEMRTYMQDADAKGENEPISRVSLHEDTDGDGVMDKHSVFADNLLLPRMVLPLDDRILIGETNTLDIYSYRDTDGDGVSDEKTLFYKGGPRGGNMEHQPSGLVWSMDNWIYTTYNAYRLRYNPNGETLKESTASNGGQWGLCQDDYGKPWFVNAGGEMGPLNFQQPIVYGQFNVSNQFPIDYREVHPLVGIPDVQGGTKRFRPEDQTLNHFTATCGQEIFRGDRLPGDLKGDLLFSEPVGRLIRRSKVEVRDGITYLSNAHPKSEFIRSTDPNFRAMNMNTGPDGCLYIVDMYRGIIQQGNWTKPGSYLRGVIDDYGFAKNIQRGRIYRLVHDDFKRGPQPEMLNESPAQLVAHLKHPNGWWRDTAQKLLILKGDKSVAPQLETIALDSDNQLARIHAIWTLEGLDALTLDLARKLFASSDPEVSRAMIRASESLYKAGKTELSTDIAVLANHSDPGVSTQAMMTAKLLKFPDHEKLIESTVKAHTSSGVKNFGTQLLKGGTKAPAKLTPDQLKQYQEGQAIYESLCFACHGPDGRGTRLPGGDGALTLAPSFVGSKILTSHKDLGIKVVLHGLTGPIDGKTYPGEMIGMASNGDAWVAAVISYVQNSFGNHLGFVKEADVKRIREEIGERSSPWTFETLMSSVPQPLPNRGQWKLTASHKPEDLKYAIDGKLDTRYTTGKHREPGMWVQVELPAPTRIAGLLLDAAKSRGDYPKGYQISISADGENWGKPVAKGKGESAKTVIEFPEQTARFIKITQTAKSRGYWSIHNMEILGAKNPGPE
ncbi:MAG: discoidin domain-containing protein [Verrucomicrobiales bacterium]|nr:discoidin domain-containing protein [Verrucomicrobiales bacterium]